MPVVKSFIKPNGAEVVFHRAKNVVSIDFAAGTAVVGVACWPSEQAHNDGMPPDWLEPIAVTIADLANIDTAIVTMDGSPFLGGTIVSDTSTGLDAAKERRWALIKMERSAHEFGGFVWGGSGFDSDAISQQRITGAVVLAMLASAAGQSFSQAWTLADNESRTLTGADMLAVGMALGAHVGGTHAIATELREQINAATTFEEVEAVTWPTT